MVKVNKDKCIGCCACTTTCPEVFEMINGLANVKKDIELGCIKETIKNCPVEAIYE
jgi:ferredoxin